MIMRYVLIAMKKWRMKMNEFKIKFLDILDNQEVYSKTYLVNSASLPMNITKTEGSFTSVDIMNEDVIDLDMIPIITKKYKLYNQKLGDNYIYVRDNVLS